MYKLLCTSTKTEYNAGTSVHQIVIDFHTKDQADLAYDRIFSDPSSIFKRHIVKLYGELDEYN
jgi:hypothetical protein